jgi:o-succinylbenzoate synthase
MTIAEVRTHRLTTSLHTPFVTALRHTTVLETVIVELVDTNGRRGFGEAPQVWRVTGESLAGAEACLAGPLADVVRGRSVDDLFDVTGDVANAVVGNFGAKAAMDVALHDLAARRIKVPLPRLLGGSRTRVETDVTLSAGDPAALAEAARARVAEGFRVLKVKVGIDPETDFSTVHAVRAAAGPDIRIRLDANQAWNVRQAVRVVRDLEDAGLDVEFVEQPVPREDVEGMAKITASVDTPIMADESVFGLRDLTKLIEIGMADLVNIKLAKCGGLSVALAMVRLAKAHGIGFIVGSMMEGPIGVGAAASLVAAAGSTLTSDLDAAWWLAGTPVIGGLAYDGASVLLPSSPGLGIEGLA